jgi:hypothetical protein
MVTKIKSGLNLSIVSNKVMLEDNIGFKGFHMGQIVIS